MFALANTASAAAIDHAACSGCSLCLLVCPVWRTTHDLRLTPHGRAKALQHGANARDIAISVESCTVCGACEPVCPENIGLVAAVVALRHQLHSTDHVELTGQDAGDDLLQNLRDTHTVLVLDAALRQSTGNILSRVTAALAEKRTMCISKDDGADIALALECGQPISPRRIERFVSPLRHAKKIIVVDGLLYRYLQLWLPRARIVSLGEALSTIPAVRRALRRTDLYVIEPRAYHANYERLVTHYDELGAETSCSFNLDLQRIAIAATARSLPQFLGTAATDNDVHVNWILKGRTVNRIVIENEGDRAAFETACRIPVVHLGDIAGGAY